MRCFYTALALLAISITLEAKGTTVKLTLRGPGLTAPVEIAEPAILAASNVWEGSFLGETQVVPPSITGPLYTLTFDVLPPEWLRQTARPMYVVSIARDARSGALLLYLPGRGESGYALNAGAMLRDTQDGRWHRPPPEWTTAIAKYMP